MKRSTAVKQKARCFPARGRDCYPVRAGSCALRLRSPPDFFELRLDALVNSLGEVAANIPHLRAPIILTARHQRKAAWDHLLPGSEKPCFGVSSTQRRWSMWNCGFVRQMAELVLELRRRQIRSPAFQS